MKEKKQTIIIVLLVMNAILIMYFGLALNRNLSSNHPLLVNQVNNLHNSIAYLDSSIAQRMHDLLEQKDNMIAVVEYDYVHIDTANHQAVIDFSLQLKAADADSRIYIVYRDLDENQIREIELDRNDGLFFTAILELDLRKNYQFDVIEKTGRGKEARLNTTPQHLIIYDRFYEKRVLMDSMGSGFTQKQIHFDFMFSVDDLGLDAFSLDHVLLNIYYADRIIDQVDVTDKLTGYAQSDWKQQYDLAVASGKISPGMNIEEFRDEYAAYTSHEGSSTRMDYTLVFPIIYDTDYPELDLNMQKAENIHAELVIVCKDGYRVYN